MHLGAKKREKKTIPAAKSNGSRFSLLSVHKTHTHRAHTNARSIRTHKRAHNFALGSGIHKREGTGTQTGDARRARIARTASGYGERLREGARINETAAGIMRAREKFSACAQTQPKETADIPQQETASLGIHTRSPAFPLHISLLLFFFVSPPLRQQQSRERRSPFDTAAAGGYTFSSSPSFISLFIPPSCLSVPAFISSTDVALGLRKHTGVRGLRE